MAPDLKAPFRSFVSCSQNNLLNCALITIQFVSQRVLCKTIFSRNTKSFRRKRILTDIQWYYLFGTGPKMPQEVSLCLNRVPFVISIFLFASFHDAMLHYFPSVIILLITISKQTICAQHVKCSHPFSFKSDCILTCPRYLTSTVVMLCNLREMHFETSHYMKKMAFS